MNALDRFRIHFSNLNHGEHEFEFEINDEFFKQFDHALIEHGLVDVLVTVNKTEDMLLFDFTMEGTLTLMCDRCGDDLYLDITGFNELMVKFGEETGEKSEDVLVLSPKAHELNVAQYIYEYISLMVPLRNVHPDDENGMSTCDEEALAKLEALRIHELTEEEKTNDPRWDILKKINLN